MPKRGHRRRKDRPRNRPRKKRKLVEPNAGWLKTGWKDGEWCFDLGCGRYKKVAKGEDGEYREVDGLSHDPIENWWPCVTFEGDARCHDCGHRIAACLAGME